MLRDSAFVAPSYVVPGVVSIVLVGLLFAALGAGQYGVWALMFALASGVPLLTTSATESVILRYRHRGRRVIDPRATPLSLLATALVATVAGALLLPDRDPVTIVTTSILSVAVGVYFVRVAQLRADLRFGPASILAVTRAIAGGVLAVLGAGAGGAPGAAVGMALGFFGAVAVSTWQTRGTTPTATNASTPRDDQWAYGLASMVIAVALFILSVGDRFILSMLRPLEEVGVYAAAYSIVDLLIRLAPSVVIVAIRTPLFRAWETANSRSLSAWVGSLFTLVLWASCVASVILSWAASVWLRDWPGEALVAPIAFGLTAAVVAAGLASIHAAAERQVKFAMLMVASAALNIVLNAALVPSIGSHGSAIATLISFATLLLLCVGDLGRSVIPSGSELAIWSLCIVAAGSTIAGTDLTMWVGLGCLALGIVPMRVTVWRVLRLPTEMAVRGTTGPGAPR